MMINRGDGGTYYRSLVFSILKCGYGWDKCLPDGCAWEAWEEVVSLGYMDNIQPEKVAEDIAKDIHKNKGSFLARIDGTPNKLIVGGA